MALSVTNSPILPENVIGLSRSEAVDYQWKQIRNWPLQSEVWPFKYGIGALSVLGATTATYINRYYRRKLKLRHFGFVTTNFPMIIAPALFTAGLHVQLISNDLILKDTKCPLCVQYRAALVSIGIGVVYPMIMSPIANFLYANRHATYRLPDVRDPKGIAGAWLKFTKPFVKEMIVLVTLHAIAASFITYKEAECLYEIKNTIEKLITEDAISEDYANVFNFGK